MTTLLRTWALLAALFLSLQRTEAAVLNFDNPLEPSLIADTTAVQAGKPFTVGVRLKMAKGWHTYWQYPGDAGGAPTVQWTLPEGFSAGPIQWPVPHPLQSVGDVITYVYENEVILPVQIVPPAQMPAGPVKLKADLTWLVCEETCIPGKGSAEIELPVGEGQPANAETFATLRDQLPSASAPPFQVSWDLSDARKPLVKVAGAPAEAKLALYPIPPGEVRLQHVETAASGSDRTFAIPLNPESPVATAGWMALLVDERPGVKPTAWYTTSPAAPAAAAAQQTTSTAPGGAPSLIAILGFAFLGGLILNVMPCVLPVIALKIFGFVKQAGEDPKLVFRLGLAFAAGVFAFFLAMAAAVIAIKAAGGVLNFGFQVQNPFILAILISLVFLFGLNLLGVFEITLGSDASTKLSDLSSKEGYAGAFTHGLFTTLLGTSCTAPYLGASLGYAVVQPSWVVILIFLMIAAGMSSPYLLLTAHPVWLKYLPKPGMWMERAKQLMGFIMIAVAVWLFTVLAKPRPDAGAAMSWYLLVLAIAAWIFGATPKRLLGGLLALSLAIGGYFALMPGPLAQKPGAAAAASSSKDGIAWQPFSEKAVQEAIAQGRPVFVDFTADWCLNCKFYERTVLADGAVRAAIEEKGVLTLKADFTQQDAEISKALAGFGRVGVPLYVLHRPGESQPIVKDALSKSGMLSDLEQIRSGLTGAVK